MIAIAACSNTQSGRRRGPDAAFRSETHVLQSDTMHILGVESFRHWGSKRLYEQGDGSKIRADQRSVAAAHEPRIFLQR